MSQDTLSQLELIQNSSALHIRRLIGQGKINPQAQNANGDDLLAEALKANVPTVKIKAILSSAHRTNKMPDILAGLCVIESKIAGPLSVCLFNLSKPRIKKDKKELILQLLALQPDKQNRHFVGIQTLLNRAIVEPMVTECPAPRLVKRSIKTNPAVVQNLAWSMV